MTFQFILLKTPSNETTTNGENTKLMDESDEPNIACGSSSTSMLSIR